MNKNHCNKKCKYFNNEIVCKSLQKTQNCYQCIITDYEFKKEELAKARVTNEALYNEIQKLKILLGDKILKEMVGDDNA